MKTVILLVALLSAGCNSKSFDAVTYRGEVISLSKSYTDFHAYRDDPNNLPKAVLPKVMALVKEAPVASAYPTRKDVDDALYQLMFPGYGYSLLALDKPVALYSLEVPGAGEDRYITFAERDGKWVRLDDFIWPESSGYLRSAEVAGEHIRYLDQHGKVLRER